MVWCWLSFRDPSTEPSPIPNARQGADPRQLLNIPERLGVSQRGENTPILFLPGTDSPLTEIQHLDLPGKARAAGLCGDELGADLTQGQGISPGSPMPQNFYFMHLVNASRASQ